ncbi:MAG: hypothetical protein MZU91_05950 [Desulfosudis oleivorans]|nr:hypothetical protein [Desulfosudis oleivorans]
MDLVSSIFDYITFFILIYVFGALNNPQLFHTGWFIQTAISQILIIHIIRTHKIPFIQSRSSIPLILSTVILAFIIIWLPFSPFARSLGFIELPSLYWIYLFFIFIAYAILTTIVKNWFYKNMDLHKDS